MDLNAGRIATSETIEQRRLGTVPISASPAGRRKKTWAEHWALHNLLVLFSLAPVT